MLTSSDLWIFLSCTKDLMIWLGFIICHKEMVLYILIMRKSIWRNLSVLGKSTRIGDCMLFLYVTRNFFDTIQFFSCKPFDLLYNHQRLYDKLQILIQLYLLSVCLTFDCNQDQDCYCDHCWFKYMYNTSF